MYNAAAPKTPVRSVGGSAPAKDDGMDVDEPQTVGLNRQAVRIEAKVKALQPLAAGGDVDAPAELLNYKAQ